MPVLPLIDLMLLAGWTALFIGFVLKAVAAVSSYRPAILGLSSIDFLMIAIASLLFAIALAARTWVKSQEPAATAARRRDETMEAWNRLQGAGGREREPAQEEALPTDPMQTNPVSSRGD